MSTNVQPNEQGTVHRMQRNATAIQITAPAAIILYNKWMGGVDKGDQLQQYYHLRLKSRKFYKYIFWYLVHVSIITHTYYKELQNNSYIEHSQTLSITTS